MGKPEEEQQHRLPPEDATAAGYGGCCTSFSVGPRCIIVLLFSVAVFLFAMFWLPPFVHRADQKDLLFNSKYKGSEMSKQRKGNLSLFQKQSAGWWKGGKPEPVTVIAAPSVSKPAANHR
ncbi:hypothetical protein RIF29_19860 [Crotalaria pallida]|uniref:Transmembrane protein n=1 Tax=Crotalaria pallida TaxID=3830 RepID=A0AAN9F4I1_CROPI